HGRTGRPSRRRTRASPPSGWPRRPAPPTAPSPTATSRVPRPPPARSGSSPGHGTAARASRVCACSLPATQKPKLGNLPNYSKVQPSLRLPAQTVKPWSCRPMYTPHRRRGEPAVWNRRPAIRAARSSRGLRFLRGGRVVTDLFGDRADVGHEQFREALRHGGQLARGRAHVVVGRAGEQVGLLCGERSAVPVHQPLAGAGALHVKV